MSSNSSSLTPTLTVGAVPPAARVWLRIVLMTVAGFESFVGLQEFAGALISMTLRFRSDNLLSMRGLPSTRSSPSRRSCLPLVVIFAPLLAAYIIAAWFADLPTMARFGEGDWSPLGLSLLGEELVFAPLAVTAMVLACLDRHLWLAALFVALPPANLLLGMIMFTIGIMIYGF